MPIELMNDHPRSTGLGIREQKNVDFLNELRVKARRAAAQLIVERGEGATELAARFDQLELWPEQDYRLQPQ